MPRTKTRKIVEPYEQLSLDPERYERPRLVFQDGALILKAVGPAAANLPSYFVWHAGHWAAPAYRYAELKKWLATDGRHITNYIPRYFHEAGQKNFKFARLDNFQVTPAETADAPLKVAESPAVYEARPVSGGQIARPYQLEAIESWKALDGRGTIVLPTGAGKSTVATLAIDSVRAPTLIVVPQLDLLHQWYENLSRIYGQENVGVYFGEKKDIRPITVTTYVSASSHLDELGNRFYLLICDEVHHLTSATWQHAARLSIAPKRLALTATYPTDFEDHLLLQELIGLPCYYKAPADLAGTYLADYQVVRVRVEFTPDEAIQYERLKAVYSPLAQDLWAALGMGWYNHIMRYQNKDPEYRKALVYKRQMEELIEMAAAKRLTLARIMALHKGQNAIIFTETNKAVYELAELFMLPAITHHTGAVERKAILDGFRAGDFGAVVTARVLNEGVDLPTAKIGIIVGGGGSSTEYVQRLGRILRRQGGATAFLYELIVRGTLEESVSNRRRLTTGKGKKHPTLGN
jgi:superfamily II DNA or RNA helicase